MLRNSTTKTTSPWLKIGESWHCTTLTSFDPVTETFAVRDDGPRERLIAVRASPQPGFASQAFERLILKTAAGETYTTTWSAGLLHQPPVLVPGKPYDFVLIERSFPKRAGTRVWHDVWQVGSGGRLLFDGGTCEIHGERLVKKEVPTQHGYSRPDLSLLDARKRHFPHAESGRATLCEPLADEPPTHTILICSPCEGAYRRWKTTSN
jgi:hypothetical protein